MKREQTTVRLPSKLKEILQREALAKGYTLKDLLIFILYQHFQNIEQE